MERRLKLLKYFNHLIANILPLVDMRPAEDEWSLAYLLCTLKGLVFYDVKTNYLNDVLNRTRTYLRRPIITLNRQQSDNGKQSNEECLFLQGFHQLSNVEDERLRQNDRSFEVRFRQEGADDAGGPYQEALSQFCQDIRSKELELFIPCPNAKEEVGFNQDKFVPNPSMTSPAVLEQYEFIGTLLL
jgi:hypothetical protein